MTKTPHVVGNVVETPHVVGSMSWAHVCLYVVEACRGERRGQHMVWKHVVDNICRGGMSWGTSWTTYVVEACRGERRGQHMSWRYVVDNICRGGMSWRHVVGNKGTS